MRSGRNPSDWEAVELDCNEFEWRFYSDNSVNGWGWRFTARALPPVGGSQSRAAAAGGETLESICAACANAAPNGVSDADVVKRPSIQLATLLLHTLLKQLQQRSGSGTRASKPNGDDSQSAVPTPKLVALLARAVTLLFACVLNRTIRQSFREHAFSLLHNALLRLRVG